MLNKKQKKQYSLIIAVACLISAIIMYNGVILLLHSTSRYSTGLGMVIFIFGLYTLFTRNVDKLIFRLLIKNSKLK